MTTRESLRCSCLCASTICASKGASEDLTRNDQGGPKYGLRDPDDDERYHHRNSELVNQNPRNEADRMIQAVADLQFRQVPVLPCLHEEWRGV